MGVASLLSCLASSTLLWSTTHGQVTVSDPGTMVVDRAGVIEHETELRLEQVLWELQNKTSAQVKILTVETTQGEEIVSFTTRHANLWGLGLADKNNGVLVVLATKERQIRVSTGLGLETWLTDGWCESLCQEAADRFFKQGRYGDGFTFMVHRICNKLAEKYDVKLEDGFHSIGGSKLTNFLLIGLLGILVIVGVLCKVLQRQKAGPGTES